MTDTRYIVTEVYGWHGGERKFMRRGDQHWIEHANGVVEHLSAADWGDELRIEPAPMVQPWVHYWRSA